MEQKKLRQQVKPQLSMPSSWDSLFDSLDQFEPSFKIKREQPVALQKRVRIKK